jgi:hypothetical protein
MTKQTAVPPAEWRGFFDRMSKGLLGTRAEIEVASLDLGDQVLAEWVPLVGITYDSGDDLLDVALAGGTNHLIRKPREISVQIDEAGLRSVAVVDAAGARQTVNLKEPLMLAAGSGGR